MPNILPGYPGEGRGWEEREEGGMRDGGVWDWRGRRVGVEREEGGCREGGEAPELCKHGGRCLGSQWPVDLTADSYYGRR